MSTYYYITFHSSSYDTSVSYSSRLQILSKDNLVLLGGDLGLKIPMSWTKEQMADHLSGYVLSNVEEMVAKLDDEEIVLAHEIIEVGKLNILWKRHLLKYDTLKKMVWVLVDTNTRGKDGFIMLDEIREAFAPFIKRRVEAAMEKVKAQTAKKTRLCLKDLNKKLDGLDIEHLKYLHYLFECNYMDDCDFDFEDEWFVDGYHECLYYWYDEGCQSFPTDLNYAVFKILSEWKERGYHKYRTAMSDIKQWTEKQPIKFDSLHQAEVDDAFDSCIRENDEQALSKALFPFAKKVRLHLEKQENEEATSLLFCIFDKMAQADKLHKEWFDCYWRGGEQTRIVLLLDIFRNLYCHIRQLPSLSWKFKEDMDIYLIIENRQHHLFGDLEVGFGDSRMDDMLRDAKDQYSDYTTMEDTLYDYLEGVYAGV